MSAEERNLFERSLQKDPFAEEASEGFEEVDPCLIENDIASLRSRLKKRTADRKRLILYRVAASVALLMILASALLIIEKRKPVEKLAYAPAPATAPVPSAPPAAKDTGPAADSNAEFKALKEKEIKKEVPARKESVNEKTEEKKAESKPAIQEKLTVAAVSQDAVQAAVEGVPKEPVSKGRAMAAKAFKLAEDTSIKMNLDTAVSAKNEVVTIGYKAEKSENIRKVPPEPAGGMEKFDKYIQENIRKPDSSAIGQRIVVVLNFSVEPNGKIDSISIIRSPGKPFSDEAIRLIREGPVWQPAQENGKAIRDQVNLRIVFK